MIALMFSFTPSVNAQIINEQANVASSVGYDPIVATLDSLLTLTYIKRLNTSAPGSSTSAFKPFEVPSYSADIYKKRIEKIQTPIPLCYNDEVRDYIDMYALKKRDLTERVMGLSKLYFPMYEQILDQQGLPLEFKYLSIVESALNPTAVSRVGATGLWQFMYGTGKLYKLKINSYIDERRDPVKATQAACQYFKDMYAIYNDWLLVIAAYNCGAGNVNRAIARSGGKKTFWEISDYLPRETRGYVPAFIAVTYLMSYTAEHNLTAVPPVISYFEADTVMIDQRTSLKAVADAINIPVELVTYLNPVYKRGIIPESDEPMPLRLPSNKVSAYLANISTIYMPNGNTPATAIASAETNVESESGALVKKYHKVRSGENLGVIASKYHCSVNDLKRWNKLKSTRLSIGQNLAVYVMARKSTEKVATKNTSNGNKNSTSTNRQASNGDSRMIWHTVQAGDSLWKIANQYEGVTVQQIKDLNNLRSNDLKVGTKLKVVITG